WVRNLSGGGVECVVEGDAGEFLERVKNLSFPVRVDRVTQQDCAPERFDGFKVRASK
ncbi:acylphosphatase, partial [Candidatus Micrarchaeota archaeon CG10_big_fil_rev_8_21_14_0_10_54_18]